VVLLIWIYYSSQIVLMGAEFTQVHAKSYKSPKIRDGLSLVRQSEARSRDPVQAGVKRSPYAAILLALGAGWLLSRMRYERTANPTTPDGPDY
jgi:hypothetical protein